MHNSDGDLSAESDDGKLSRFSMPETILLCIEEAETASSVGREFSDVVSEFLIQANGKKISASEVVKIVDILMTKI